MQKAAGDPFAYGCPVLEAIPENTAYDVIVDAILESGFREMLKAFC